MRAVLVATTVRVLLLGLGLAAFYGINAAVGHPVDAEAHLDFVPSPAQTVDERLTAAHGCWVDEAPSDVALPGHVVVTLRDGRTVYGGPRLVGLALDQRFGGKPAGLTIHSFCR